MTKTEAERIAAQGHALRPDWPLASLMTILAAHRTKAYRDVAVALAWIATDPQTQTPGRLNESGPWWKATQAGEPTFTTVNLRCTEHPTEPAGRCGPCDKAAAVVDYQAKVREVREALKVARA